jgi:hypothetical protein
MDALTVIIAVATAAGSGAIGALWGQRSGRADVEDRRAPELRSLENDARRAAARADQAERVGRATAERWREAAMAPYLAEVVPPVYVSRPAPRELDAIAARLRGFAFLDAVAVADRTGLILSRVGCAEDSDVAVLAAHVASLEAGSEGCLEGLREVQVVTSDARHMTVRPLPEWTRGAWLAALSRSQPPAPLAMDAAIAGAVLSRSEDPAEARFRLRNASGKERSVLAGSSGPVGEGRGPAVRQLVAELTRSLASTGAAALFLTQNGRLLCGAQTDGPGEALAGLLAGKLSAFRDAATRALHGSVTRVEVVGRDRDLSTLAPLSSDSRFSLLSITRGAPLDALEVDRLVGRIRRLVPSALSEATGLVAGAAS